MGLTHIVAGAAGAGGLAASALGLSTAAAAQVWDAGWNRWGVWMNNVFIPTF